MKTERRERAAQIKRQDLKLIFKKSRRLNICGFLDCRCGLKFEAQTELDLTRFAESGGNSSVKIKRQRTRQTSLVAVVEEVKGFKNRFQRNFFRELKYL